MKIVGVMLAISVALAGGIGAATADPWKDESGHGSWGESYRNHEEYWPRRYHRKHRHEFRAYKEEYRRGRCKIERKWDGDEYKEEIKCKRRPSYVYRY
ncbi:MAG: hypothetical protein EOR84_23810 [Mesorhizobium sp.]|uniref:hypothetical protein n=1 Tax=Mesorhizobium sp. TaxID=1871066 RepID=UPI000FE7168D|nr:hypothetical protein [Mesorhizobium sp.]RWM89649.1 MAG: hypothetical protein EOR84_23810 [Mesorhizobium sp.]